MRFMRRLVIVIFVVILLIIGLFIANFIPVSRVTTQDVTMSTEQLTKSIVDQMFPQSKYTIENGMIHFSTPIAANYQTLVLEQIIFGRFVEDKNEYFAILKAPDNVTVHAGGFYYRIGAVFDAETNKRKSQTKDFTADEGEISILKGKSKDYVLFLGSTTYQGYTSPTGGIYDARGGNWIQTWPESSDFWEHRYAVFGNDRLILYKKVLDSVEYETTIPPFHFEPEKELIWDSQAEMFR
jgi:hypothetical protein